MGRRRESVFVDAGVFLRFLTGSPERDYRRARTLFEQAERGSIVLETSVLVVAQVLAELRDVRGLDRREVRRVGEAILGTRNLRMREKALLRRALELSLQLDVEVGEALNIAHAGGRSGLAVATAEPRRYGGGAHLYEWGRHG